MRLRLDGRGRRLLGRMPNIYSATELVLIAPLAEQGARLVWAVATPVTLASDQVRVVSHDPGGPVEARARFLVGEGQRTELLPVDLAVRAAAPTALSQIGLAGDALDRAADLATAAPYYNPRPVDRAGVRALLDDAFHGRRPA